MLPFFGVVQSAARRRWNLATDGLNSDKIRERVLGYIDTRGRPSIPGGDAVEGHSRQATEPAFPAPPIEAFDWDVDGKINRFEHWKLDGEETHSDVGMVNVVPSSPSNFSAKTTICGIDLEVRRDGKHLNLHILLHEDGHLERHEDGHLEQWRFEELETAIPKLACILAAARLAADSDEDESEGLAFRGYMS
jgi:hypothetical protein